MAVSELVEEFAGKPVVDWDQDQGIDNPQGVIYRISMEYEQGEDGLRWSDCFAQFMSHPAAGEITGLAVGNWCGYDGTSSAEIVATLVAAQTRLPHLTALFLGDISFEECEISWIQQCNVSPLLDAYPRLEHFRVRGGEGLSLGHCSHARLKELAIESGGLSREVIRQIVTGNLPALEHLEIWLGDESYGADTVVDDLVPILFGTRFPNLTYLGLCNSEYTDEIAEMVAQAPILPQLEVLDLSLGTLSDRGAAALLEAPTLAKLDRLDIQHHYCSEAMVARLKALEIEVDADERQQAELDEGRECRYVAHSE